jgi:hypothetical protein
MSRQDIQQSVKNIVASFQSNCPERLADHQRAIECFDELVKRGLTKKRGNTLLPVDRAHKIYPESRQN